MKFLISIYKSFLGGLERVLEPWLLPSLARFTFAATLLVYFWNSAWLKLGDGWSGIFHPSSGAYFQIYPRAVEAAGYDPSALSAFHKLVVLAGTWAEFLLPALIVLGLLTRLAALGMIGFVALQTLTDLYGLRLIEDPKSVGAWFDRLPDAVITDQRLFWVTVLTILVVRGGGPISLDRLLMGIGPDRRQRQ